MIKLSDIVREISLKEKIVKVPQEVLSKSKELYDYITKIKDKVVKKGTVDYNNPYIDSKLKNYFQLKDLRGADLNVTVGLYNDVNDAGAARMDTVRDVFNVNLAFLDDYSYEYFEEVVEHELVHAMDPKARDIKIVSRLAHKDAEPDQFEKYVKSPAEFDAFTAPLVNKIKTSVNKTGDQKQTYRNLLLRMFSDLKTQDADEILQKDEYAPLAWLFTKAEWTEDNWSQAWISYRSDLDKIKAWTTKPTLYKQFLKRLGTELV